LDIMVPVLVNDSY